MLLAQDQKFKSTFFTYNRAPLLCDYGVRTPIFSHHPNHLRATQATVAFRRFFHFGFGLASRIVVRSLGLAGSCCASIKLVLD